MLKGFIIGALSVGVCWWLQWHSLNNQEIGHYIPGSLTAEEMEYYPPDYGSEPYNALPEYQKGSGPVFLTIEDLG